MEGNKGEKMSDREKLEQVYEIVKNYDDCEDAKDLYLLLNEVLNLVKPRQVWVHKGASFKITNERGETLVITGK